MKNYPIGDFLIQIKNAAAVEKKEVITSKSKALRRIAEVLKKEGYLSDIKEEENKLSVSIAFRHKEPVLMNLRLVSTPGLRIYKGIGELKKRRKASKLILSTSKGMMSSIEAKKENIGGEVIAEVW